MVATRSAGFTPATSATPGEASNPQGFWIDSEWDDGPRQHGIGVYRLDPGLSWAGQAMPADVQGATVRSEWRTRQWSAEGSVDWLRSISGRTRDGSYASDFTSRYRELCAHLGVIATRNNRGVAHENGAIEGPHRHWKRRLEQQLIQRGAHYEITIISTPQARARSRREGLLPPMRGVSHEPLQALIATALACAVAWLVERWVGMADLSMVFIVAVVLVAARTRMTAAVVAALLSFLAYNFFFIEPRFTFNIGAPLAAGQTPPVATQERRTMDVAAGLAWLWRRLKGDDIDPPR